MEAELTALDERIKTLIRLADGLRAENSELRQLVASMQGENQQMRDRVSSARARLEGLLSRIPDSET